MCSQILKMMDCGFVCEITLLLLVVMGGIASRTGYQYLIYLEINTCILVFTHGRVGHRSTHARYHIDWYNARYVETSIFT